MTFHASFKSIKYNKSYAGINGGMLIRFLAEDMGKLRLFCPVGILGCLENTCTHDLITVYNNGALANHAWVGEQKKPPQ